MHVAKCDNLTPAKVAECTPLVRARKADVHRANVECNTYEINSPHSLIHEFQCAILHYLVNGIILPIDVLAILEYELNNVVVTPF